MGSERAIVKEELRKLSSELVLQSRQEIERIVDKIFWRTVILLVAVAGLAVVSIIIFRKI